MLSNKNNKAVLATLALMLLSLSLASSMAVITANYASAQPADTGALAPINATTTVEGDCNATNANVTGTSNATNANVTGTCNPTNATSTSDAGTAAGNQTIGGPLALYGGGGGQ